MTEKEILEVFRKAGAIITKSHIVYTSGKHGSAYVNKDALYPNTKAISSLCKVMAEEFKDKNVDLVLAPALGGIILSQWIAHHLSALTNKEVLAVYSEKDGNGNFVIKRGYDKLITNKNVLVVEDILNTGGSVKKVIQVAKEKDANVVGLSALCNRGAVTAEMVDVATLHALVTVNLEAWEAADCPLCAKKVPINTEVGKGKTQNS
jgi:orotate phosphoribosyltransferase